MSTTDITQTMLNEAFLGPGEYCARIRKAGKNVKTQAAQYAASKLPLELGAWSTALAYAKPLDRDDKLAIGVATLLKAGAARVVRIDVAHPETPNAGFMYRIESV